MIISIGYRVNSKQGITFRKWATNILKEHLIKGYTVNQERLNYQMVVIQYNVYMTIVATLSQLFQSTYNISSFLLKK